MVRRIVVGALWVGLVAVRASGAGQVVTMQGGATPPAVTPSAAPKGTGLIVGQVVDASSGRPVAGALVSFAANLPMPMEDMGPAPNPQARRVITNGEGRFVFHSVPPGRVGLGASASTYIPASPGQRRPMGPSQPFMLADGERVASVTIRMWKYAAVEGRVLDENDEPVVGTPVRVWRREWSGGRLRLTAGQSANTDDRGVFRIPQLVPGDYYVSVPSVQQTLPLSVVQAYQELAQGGRGAAPADLARQLSVSGAPQIIAAGQRIGEHVLQSGRFNPGPARPVGQGGRVFVYPAAFEPNLDQEPMHLGSGEERENIDLTLRLVPGVTVSGVLTGPEGPVAHVGVQLIQSRLHGTVPSSGVEAARTATDASGAFTFLGVPGDEYKLIVMFVPRPPVQGATTIINSGGATTTVTTMGSEGAASVPSEPTLYANVDLSVAEKDIAGLNVPVHVGARISGTVVFSGATAPPTPEQIARIAINMRPVTGSLAGVLSPGRVDADLKIRTAGHPAGRYFVTASVPAPGWSLASAMVGTRDVSRSGIEVEDTDVTNLVLTFSDRRTEVTGTVRAKAVTGDPDAVVVLFPSDLRGWIADGMNPRLMGTARTSPYGVYTIAGLPPGDYRAIALSEDLALDARDPAFLGRLGQLGTTIALREGDKRTLDLRTETPPRRAPEPMPEAILNETSGPFVPDVPSTPEPQTPARDVTVAKQSSAGVIAGTVVTDDASNRPIRKVQIELSGSGLRPSRVTTSDDAGRFLFGDLPAGRYTLQASRPPYVDTAYGATRQGRTGATIALTEGQRVTDLTIRMIRGAVIGGTVLDEFGLPVERAQVTVLRRRPGSDVAQLVTGGGSMFMPTDDRGRFRAYGLLPGDYIVSVANRNASGSDLTRITDADLRWARGALSPLRPGVVPPPPPSPTIGNAPVYHPGVTDLANARVITLGVAEERLGVDVTMVTVPAAKVEGRVVTTDGQRPAQLQMSMIQEGLRVPMVSPNVFVRPAADGSFQVQGVVPGRYVITARAASRPPAAAPAAPPGGRGAAPNLDLWAMQTIEVNGQDVTGISLLLAPGLTVRGRIVFERTTAIPPERFSGVSVRLGPAATVGVSLGTTPATIAEDGTFELLGVTPNSYRVSATAPGGTLRLPMWTMKSAMAGGRDVADTPLVVTPGADVTDLVVTMTDRVTEMTGLLLDGAGRPAPELTILVFPVDRALWSRDLRRRPPPTRPGTDGRYHLAGMPPGEYYMVALSEVEQEELYDPAFLESLIPAALKFSLAEGEKKVQDFTLTGR